jgi:hypothetical protein
MPLLAFPRPVFARNNGIAGTVGRLFPGIFKFVSSVLFKPHQLMRKLKKSSQEAKNE